MKPKNKAAIIKPVPEMIEVCECGEPTRDVAPDYVSYCDLCETIVEGHTKRVPRSEVFEE